MKTINLQGKEYAPVKERLKAFHSDHKEPSIQTKYQVLPDSKTIIFTATIWPKSINERVKYTGHSMGAYGKPKAFEKLESIAVGRALAFAGYSADGEIASYEEMEDFIAVKDEPLATEKQQSLMYELIRTSVFNEAEKSRYESEVETMTQARAGAAIDYFKDHQMDIISHKSGRGNTGDIGKAVLDAVDNPRK